MKLCSKRPQATLPNGLKNEVDSEMTNDKLSMVETNVMFLRKSLNEEIQMRHDMIEELGSLKRRNQVWRVEDENWCVDEIGLALDYRRVDRESEWSLKFAAEKNRRRKAKSEVRDQRFERCCGWFAEAVSGEIENFRMKLKIHRHWRFQPSEFSSFPKVPLSQNLNANNLNLYYLQPIFVNRKLKDHERKLPRLSITWRQK